MRSICERSSSRRSSASKRRSASRGRPSRRGSSAGSSGWGSARRPSARRIRCTSTPITPEPSCRRANAAIAIRARSRIAPSEPSFRAAAIWARSASSSSSESSPRLARSSSRTPWRRRRDLDGAEEEAVEHQLEHAPVLLALGERRGERLAEVLLRGPADLAQDLERVEHLRGADRDALAAQLLPELQYARRQALRRHRRAIRSFSPTRSATTSMSVRCLTITDIVSVNVSASMSSTPSSSSARPSRSTRRSTAASSGRARAPCRSPRPACGRPSRTARARAGARSRARARASG